MRKQARIARRKGCTVRRLNLEPLEQRVMLASDFGDAPAPYAVLAAEYGARHEAVGPTLGLLRDSEADGVHSSDADGDDQHGDSDEDGVAFGEVRVGQVGAIATVTVSNAPAGARLDAWIDFNGDGNWGNVGEQVFASRLVNEGTNELHFAVPIDAAVGATYARFRLSTAGQLGTGGKSADGEVEDVRVELLPPTESAALFAARSLEGEGYFIHRNIELGDIDGDGDLDYVSSGSGVTWHEVQDGHVIGQHLVAPSDPVGSGTFDIVLSDLDGDGDLDVIVDGHTTLLSEQFASFFWLENEGAGSFAAHALGNPYGGMSGFSVIDFESDGDLDIVGNNSNLWLLINDGAQNFTPEQVNYVNDIDGPALMNDLDADGDLDFVVASNGYNSRRLVVLENQGGGRFNQRTITTVWDDIIRVALADLDRDGDEEIVYSLSEGSLSLWENNGGMQFSYRSIGYQNFYNGGTLAIFDINGDGGEDIVTSTETTGTGWWQRLETGEFEFHEASRYWLQSTTAGDFDGDGDLDLLGVRGTAQYSIEMKPLLWFENVAARVSLDVTTRSAQEIGDGTISYTFRRTGLLDRPMTVQFQVGGSAAFGSDYQQIGAATYSGTLGAMNFPAGADELQLVLSPLDDALLESNETIILTLLPGANYVEFDVTPLASRIVDNEAGDFGDAPGPYPTTLADDGARHGNIGPRLGARRDAESDGAPAGQADGDNATGGDDGDGVLFGEVRVGGSDATFYVYVMNSPQSASLDAWIDFDGDGSWRGLGEHVAVSFAVTNGLNEIRFAVPVGARSGNTYARIRLSTAGGLGPTGAAQDGEVEDYQIWIEPPLGPGGPFATPRPIASQVDIFAYGDLDRDGDSDLVTLYDGYFGNLNQHFWHENIGTRFVAHEIPLIPYVGNIVQGSLIVADMNGDGWNDLLIQSYYSMVVYVNDRAGGFAVEWELLNPSLSNYGDRWLQVFDADADGDNDILLPSQDGTQAEIVLLRNRGDATFERERAVWGQIDYAKVADIDRDGDLDLIGIQRYTWAPVVGYNDGTGELRIVSIRDPWYANTYDHVQAVDLDGDGDLDVLASGSALNWFENRGSEGFVQRWLPNGGNPDPGSNAFAADINGDGKIDVVAARVRNQMLAWYQNLGNGEFTRRTIGANAPNDTLAVPMDVDGDGDLDLVVRTSTYPALVWYESLSMLSGDYNADGTVDAADYSVWRDAMGAAGLTPYGGADGDGDGVVDQDDYLVWKANFGRVAESGGGAVESGFRPQAVVGSGTAGRASSGTPVQAAGSLGQGAGGGARAMRMRRALELFGGGEDIERTRNRPPAKLGDAGHAVFSVRPRDLALLAWRKVAVTRWQGSRNELAAGSAAGIHSQDADEADGVFEALGSGTLRLGTR